ncbi:Dual specificity protein phosphatase 23 [Eumeta japonica]|uniref:Dual specificity protein phosphatase 23 n=1 Tax=Eumeta variegata TaxID=151549 RepID=A0A4C1U3J4_EUMVA|nr:Dual specificity protein phosphatase 23 [Eumeta japonica]
MHQSVKLQKLLFKYQDNLVSSKEEPSNSDDVAFKPERKNEDEDSYPPYNFSWFIDNKVAAMGWPQTVGNLNYLVDRGINRLITLSPERIPPILECQKPLKWSEIRINEFRAPTLKQILKFIEICQRSEIRGEVIGVHCRQGHGRTGVMLACYLVHFHDMAPERAILTVRLRRPGSVETYEQEKAVCYYHDCRRGTVTHINYKLVDDKQYFDENINRMSDDEHSRRSESSEEEIEPAGIIEEEPVTKAMVINHKIYF